MCALSSSSRKLESPRGRLVLAVGFLAVAVGTFVAYRTPATGYEASIYDATPTVYWGCLAAAFLIAVVAQFYALDSKLPAALAGVAFASVLAIPLVRGYFFVGPADSLTHLGWMRDILGGTLDPVALLYPGLHTASLVVADVTGLPLTTAPLVVVLVAALTFLVTVPLAVVGMTDSPRAAGIATLVAVMMLPINHVSVHYMEPHPISDTILLFPLGLYLFARYLTSRRPDGFRPTGIGVVFAVYLLGVVLYHPQQALTVLVFLVPAAVTRYVAGRRFPDSRIATHRPIYAQTGLLAVAFGLWTFSRSRVRRTYDNVVSEFFGLFDPASSTEPAAVVGQRAGSLEAIGVSPIEIFLKLFLASATLAALVGVVTLLLAGDRLAAFRDAGRPRAAGDGTLDRLTRFVSTDRIDGGSRAMLTYLSIGLFALLPFSLVLLVAGDASDLFFRALGTIMAVVTVYAAIVAVRLTGMGASGGVAADGGSDDVAADGGWTLGTGRRVVVGLVVAVLLVQTLAVVYPSPYFYQPNQQVSEQSYTGYENTFAHYDADVQILGLRQAPWRFHHAIYGVEAPPGNDYRYRWSGQRIFPEDSGDLVGALDGERYLAVTSATRLREVEAFDERRYSVANFRAFDNQVGVARVQSNGEYTLYHVADRPGASQATLVDGGAR